MSDVQLMSKQANTQSARSFGVESSASPIDRRGVVAAPEVIVIIPAYNEERFIGSVVLKAAKHADRVIVVDDGSTDATAEVAAAAGANVVQHDTNLGKGCALNTGFQEARQLGAKLVVTIDGDGQHFPEEMDHIIKPILEGQADIVVGSRYLEGACDVPLHRVWGHYFFNAMTTHLSGVRVTDSQSGFRAFSRKALATISFDSRGFSVESEMQFLAHEYDLRIMEVPITIKYPDRPKRFVISHGLMVLSGMLKLVGQHRPLLYFGVPGLLLLLIGLLWGAWVVEIYRRGQVLPVGYSLLSGLFITLGALSTFTGLILHSVRGLLLGLIRPKKDDG